MERTAGQDYTAVTQTITFTPGLTSQTRSSDALVDRRTFTVTERSDQRRIGSATQRPCRSWTDALVTHNPPAIDHKDVRGWETEEQKLPAAPHQRRHA
ncbi:MAG: hypothetical protein U0821_04200 [Chloroflexota bacterium]